MRKYLSLFLTLCLPLCANAQLTFNEPQPRQHVHDRLQWSIAAGWRADHSELSHSPVVDLGLSIRLKQPISLIGRISLQPEQDSYFVTNLSIGSLAVGFRFQSSRKFINPYGSLEVDHSWYFGQTVLYSYDSGRVMSRVSSRAFRTGAALSVGAAMNVFSRLGIDLGVRKVFNDSHDIQNVMTTPPPNGDAVWPFPRELFNQTVVYLQGRIGLF